MHLLGEAPITSFNKVKIEGGIRALLRTVGHNGEAQVVDGEGGVRGGRSLYDLIFSNTAPRKPRQRISKDLVCGTHFEYAKH